MALNDVPTAPDKKKSADALRDAVVKHEAALLMLESLEGAKKSQQTAQTGTRTGVTEAQATSHDAKTATKPADRTTVADRQTSTERQGLAQSDATDTKQFRQAVIAKSQEFETRVANNLKVAKAGTFGITDVLNNFDRLAQEATALPLAQIQTDLKTLSPTDPSVKPIRDAEIKLLHAPGIIEINKAQVAYDAAGIAAAKPNSKPNSAELVAIARQAKDLAFQDPAVKDHFAPIINACETLVQKYHLDVTAQPSSKPGQDTTVQAPRQGDQTQKTQADTKPVNTDGPVTPQMLAQLDAKVAQDTPARKQLEAQLWGDPTKQENAPKYQQAQTDIWNMVGELRKFPEDQQKAFNQAFFGPNGSAAEKQKYIDTVTANDKVLHDSATDLLKLTGDKVPLAAEWYNHNMSSFTAVATYYQAVGEADAKGDTKTAKDLWTDAQKKYPLESQFLTDNLGNPDALRLDAKFTGDTQTLYKAGLEMMTKGDVKTAEQFFKDSIAAADIKYADNVAQSGPRVKEIAAKLSSGTPLSSDEKLQLASEGFSQIDALTGPVTARINAATALSQLNQVTDGQAAGQYQSGPGGQAYQAEIAGWYKDASDKAKNIDSKDIKTIGNALNSAANSNLDLNKPENAQLKYGILNQAAILTGGKLWQPDETGKMVQKVTTSGYSDLSFTAPKMQAAFLITQQKGTDAVAAIKEAGLRESQAKGWQLHDMANNDKQLAMLMQQAHPLDPNHYLDVMTRSDSMWKTPLQAVGGLLVFAAASYATKKLVNPALIEDMAPALAEKGLIGTVAKTTLKYAPTIAGVATASGFSVGVDHLGATHEGAITAVGKGLSLVALVKGGQYMSRVGMAGVAPEYAEGMFGANTGKALTKDAVLGRVVQEIGGKPLAQADMTAGQLVEKLSAGTTRSESTAAIRALKSLPEDTQIFKKGVLNPAVDKAFLGTSQSELSGLARQGLEAAGAKPIGRVLPSLSEVKGALKGNAIDIQNGDVNAINRELAARTAVANRFAGLARNATEQNVLSRVATEVSGPEGNLSKDQLLAVAKRQGVEQKKLGALANVIGEDAQILKGGRWQGEFKSLPDDVKAQLKEVAGKVTPAGESPSLTSAQLANFANENKIPLDQFKGILKEDPTIIKNGVWNPDMLIRDPKTGVVARAIDTPNFKGVMNLDKMQTSQLYAKLAKPAGSEKSVLIRLAQRANQDVPLNDVRGITKQELVETMTGRGMTEEQIASKYPKLAKLKDTDLIVKDGKFQSGLVSRDIPETMTKKDFIAWYKQANNVDLSDPAQLANSPWAKSSLSKAADDANIIKGGKWQINLPRAAKQSIEEAKVSLRPKDVGLMEQSGNFLMKDTQANLTAGQLVEAMQTAKIDPTKIEALSKLPPETLLVKDGKVLSPVQVDRELSPTSKVFRAFSQQGTLNLNDTQKAVLSGEATDKAFAEPWYKVDGKIGWRHPFKTSKQGAQAVINGWSDGISNLKNSKGGLTGFQGALDPSAGTFRSTGAGFGMQNWLSGTGGSLGAYTLYNGLSSLGGGWDDQLGESTSPMEEFERRMGYGKSFQQNMYSYLWMPQMPNLFSELGGNATWNATKQIFFTSSGEPLGEVFQGALSGGPSQTYKLANELKDVKAANDKPLVNNPSLLDQQPINPQSLGPADTTTPTPAQDTTGAQQPDTTGTQKPDTTPKTGVKQSAALPQDAAKPVVTPVQPATKRSGDYIDDQLSGNLGN